MDQYRDLNKDTRKRRTNRRRKRKNNARIIFAIGIALVILLGIGAAVLCFLSELGGRPKERTAGFSAGADDDW